MAEKADIWYVSLRVDGYRTRVDAVRQMKLRSLPPYLCFSLMRFVFDMKTLSKVKVHDKFKFPLQLDLGGFVDEEACADGATTAYELSTVLIHRGSTASAGHYVARVLNESDGVWWEFNDEEVKRLGDLPHSGAPPTTSTSKAGEGSKGLTPQKRAASNGDQGAGREEPAEVSSKDAYMLVYRRASAVASRSDGGGRTTSNGAAAPQLDEELAEYVNNALKAQEQKETAYNEMVGEISAEIERRRSAVRGVFGAIAESSAEGGGVEPEELRFCDVQQLGEWVDASGFDAELNGDDGMCSDGGAEGSMMGHPPADVLKISNTELLCDEHAKVRLGPGAKLRVLPISAYRALTDVATVEPELSLSDVCWDCLRSDLRGIAMAEEDADRLNALLEDASSVLDGTYERKGRGRQPFFLVSRQWLRGWVGRSGRSLGSTSPTERLACPHGLLSPKTGAARHHGVTIPEPMWRYICDEWRSTGGTVVAAGSEDGTTVGQPNGSADASTEAEVVILEDGGEEGREDGEGSSGSVLVEYAEKGAHSRECSACLKDSHASGQQDEEDREARRVEREMVPMLASGVSSLQMAPGAECRLLPAEWLRAWQKYIAPMKAKKSDGVAPRPPPLRTAFTPLLCDCAEHSASPWLAVPPPALQRRRGRWGVALDEYGLDRNLFAVISQDEWTALAALYSTGCAFSGVFARAVGDNETELHLDTTPGVCATTVNDRESALRVAALTYSDAELGVELVVDDEAAQLASLSAPSVNELLAKAESGGAGGRRPKRSRRQGVATLTVDSNNTLSHVKAKLWEALQVHPRNARLHYRGQLLEAEGVSLAEAAVFAGDTLYVVDTKEFDDNDYLAMVPDAAMLGGGGDEGRRAGVEQGFKNTVLVGSGTSAP